MIEFYLQTFMETTVSCDGHKDRHRPNKLKLRQFNFQSKVYLNLYSSNYNLANQ